MKQSRTSGSGGLGIRGRLYKCIVVLTVIQVFIFSGCGEGGGGQESAESSKDGLIQYKLLQSKDFKYLGAFRVPQDDMGSPLYHGLNYGGSVIAYNSTSNSLFIVGHDWDQMVAEISIPNLVNSSDINNLNTATVIQNLSDVTEGNRLNLKSDGSPVLVNGAKIGGLLKYGNRLIGSVYAYYDGGSQAVRSHFISGLSLSATGDFEGMFEVGSKPDPVPQAGHVAGYMTAIPASWRTALGGKVLTGMSAISILSRTSSGPAAFSFDPDSLNPSTPAPTYALIDYPLSHQTIGTYSTSQTLYNKGSHHSGVIFPSGTRSIIFTGRQGMGEACYGKGTNILSEHGNRYDYPVPKNTCMGAVMTSAGTQCCYDPVDLTYGAHTYPYVDYAWAYDAYDLARVKNGGRIVDNPSPNLVDGVSASSTDTYKPWHIKPYATWKFTFPTTQRGYSIFSGASAYDETNKRLYLVQVGTDQNRPLIHVFQVNTKY